MILYGKNPTDLPNYDLGHYQTGSETIVGCYSGPNGGLTTVRRVEKHLSVLDADIDFIDTAPHQDESSKLNTRKKNKNKPLVSVQISLAPKQQQQQQKQKIPVDNTTMVIKVAGREYCVTNNKKHNSKSHSLDDLTAENNNSEDVKCKNVTSIEEQRKECCDKNFALAKSKSEGNPFEHKKRGKIKRLAQRPAATGKKWLHEFNVDRFFLFCMIYRMFCASWQRCA